MPTLIGCDFTSRPTRQKPITVAVASVDLPEFSTTQKSETLVLKTILRFENLIDFERAISVGSTCLSATWIGGFDLPFGLPRELVQTLGWPLQWESCVQHFCKLERSLIRELFKNFCAPRPVGSKFAHRATDYIAHSSPSMKWVNPPVTYMLHAAMPVLLRANLTLPGMHAGDPDRVGLETYPALLAREIIGNHSYKSDDKQKQNLERYQARHAILNALSSGHYSLGFKLKAERALISQMLEDASGDSLDATLCAVQAAWGAKQFHHGDKMYGLERSMDPLEGWILTS